MRGEQSPSLNDLIRYLFEVNVIRLIVLMEEAQTLPADFDKPFGVLGQANDQGPLGGEKLFRQRAPGDDRYAGGLYATICKVDAGRRFRCSRHTQKDHVRFF